MKDIILDRDKWLSVKDASTRSGIGLQLLYEAIHRKELRVLKPGSRNFKIHVDELERWAASKVKGATK